MKNQLFAEKILRSTKIILLTGSLLDEKCEVIVNAANVHLTAGGGICGAFHQAAGNEIFEECQEILKRQKRTAIETGEAVMTSAGQLLHRVKAVIHSAGPIFDSRKDINDLAQLLSKAYRSSLELAANPHGHPECISSNVFDPQPMRSIGFPSIGTGIYSFPIDIAAAVALRTVKDFIEKNPKAFDEIRFVFLPLSQDLKTAPSFQKALNAF